MTEKKSSQLSDNARRLELSVITALTVDGVPSEADILSLAGHLRAIPLYSVSDEEFSDVIRRLHEALTIEMGIGTCVFDTHAPWLQARKADIEPFYWGRYQTELRKQCWAPKVVTALDKVTDDILDLMGNPDGDDGWPRRGLVMGDVQSGKTSNYTGLICKAADAGYKLVILLTGTLESLRRQTQERLDSGFVGLDSSGVVNRNRHRREIGVGLVNGARAAGVFTSTIGDFKAATVNQLGFKLRDYKEPVLLVVKKNKRILENLTDWLITFNANHSGHINLPLLMIDDEADNASVNTNPAKATAINGGIRSLLKVFPRSSYVGFTATPFANVFINPDTTDAMVGDDLFPRDFIYALDAPTNWGEDERQFNEEYFRDLIALAIMFRQTEILVKQQNWYQGGYRANIVTYTLAKLNCMITEQADGKQLDLRGIWAKQGVSTPILEQIATIAARVFELLTDPGRPKDNVTEWAKMQACWDQIKSEKIQLSSGIQSAMVDSSFVKNAAKDAREIQATDNGIATQVAVFNVPSAQWERMRSWAIERNLLTTTQSDLLRLASQIPRKIPTGKQCAVISKIHEKLLEAGFPV